MFATLSVFVVPILAAVVLSTLLISESRWSRSIGQGRCGVLGVLLSGLSTIVMLGADGAEPVCEANVSVWSNPHVEIAAATDQAREPARQDKLHEPIPHGTDGIDERNVSEVDAGYLPEWISTLPIRTGELHRTTVSSGPHVRTRDCAKALDKELKAATDDYVDWWIQEAFSVPGASRWINLDLAYINHHLRNHKYVYDEVRKYSVGPMHTSFAMLEFDERFREYLNVQWEEAVAKSRLMKMGMVGGAALGLLSVIFTYLRLDTATRGFYTGRLQFLAVAAILALIAAGVFAARWIPWL